MCSQGRNSNASTVHRAAALFVTAALIPGLLLAGNNTNKGANPNGKPFVELGGQIVEVEGEISDLQDQIDALVGRVDTVEGLQTAMATAITNLQAENVTLQNQIDANAADVDSLEAQISALNSDILDLQAQIDANGDADGALQAQVDDLAGQVTTLSLAIDTLEGNLQASIDNNSALISDMQIQLDALEQELAEKQNRVNGLCADGSAIREILADGSVICQLASGGGSGNLQTVFSSNCRNGSNSGGARAYCPAGYLAVNSGYHGHGTRIDNLYAISNYAYVQGYSAIHLCAYATCARIQP